MSQSIFLKIDATVICSILFILMILSVGFGNKMRKSFWGATEGETKGGVNSLLGALFGLWGFMLAFSFGQSGIRFENVRSMIVEEATVLRGSILLSDLFPDSVREGFRADFKKYLELRIAYYDHVTDETRFRGIQADLSKTETALWARAVGQYNLPDMGFTAGNMIASLTKLSDIAIKREALLKAGIPPPIGYALIILGLAICFVGGFTTPSIQRKEWLVIIAFALLATLILYITIDLARPMRGLIKPDTAEETIIHLRQLF
jgi:hypothetical protein